MFDHEFISFVRFLHPIFLILVDTMPFGGVGNSGIGGYHGKFTFEEFSHKRSCMIRAQSMEVANS